MIDLCLVTISFSEFDQPQVKREQS